MRWPTALVAGALLGCAARLPATPHAWLDRIWSDARAEIYPRELASAFSDARRAELAARAHSMDELAPDVELAADTPTSIARALLAPGGRC